MPAELPVFSSHTDATNFYITYWMGADDESSNLLKTGLRYQSTDGREYRSVPAETADASWVDANQWSDLLGLIEGFRGQLAATLTVSGALTIDNGDDGTTLGLNESAINAGRLNGQTAQQIIDAARTRQRVHDVDFLIDPNSDEIPTESGATWATTSAGNGLTGLTLYRRLATGANSVIDNLIPGDYVLSANGDSIDVAYIVKADPESGALILASVGEDELTPLELQLVQTLKEFGANRITGLLTALEEFGIDNLRNETQINALIDAKIDPLAAAMAALVNFGSQRAVDLLIALENFGPSNLINIQDVAGWYFERNLSIDFHPAKGSTDSTHPNYNAPLQAPYSDMNVYATPNGGQFGFHFRNVGIAGDTNWVRVR